MEHEFLHAHSNSFRTFGTLINILNVWFFSPINGNNDNDNYVYPIGISWLLNKMDNGKAYHAV